MSLGCKRFVPELPLFCFQAVTPFNLFVTQGQNKKKEVKERSGKSPLTYSNIFRAFSGGDNEKILIFFKKLFNLHQTPLNTFSDR